VCDLLLPPSSLGCAGVMTAAADGAAPPSSARLDGGGAMAAMAVV